jgi:hypothetical protein
MSNSIINKFLARLRSNEAKSDFWFEQIEEKVYLIFFSNKNKKIFFSC